MAEDHLKRTTSFGSRRDEPSFEEDPLVELARIVAEDGGFRRQDRVPELRPARNEPRRGGLSPEEELANQLEAELMQDVDLPARQPLTELRGHGAIPEGQAGHVPLRPAGAAQQHQPSRFPHFSVEDARPAAAPPESRHGRLAPEFELGETAQWRQPDRPAHDDLAEQFGDDFTDSDAFAGDSLSSEVFDGDYGAAGEGSAAMTEPAYAESYSAAYEDGDSDPDEFIDEDVDTGPPPARRAAVRGRRSYKGLLAAGGVLTLVIAGGAVMAVVGIPGPGSDSGDPPIIRAESGPAKIEPEGTAQAQSGDGAGQAVYDRVAGRAPKSDEKLVDRAEEPRQVSRVVLPQAEAGSGDPGSGSETSVSDGSADRTAATVARQGASPAGERIGGQISSETPAMQSGPRIEPVGPRRVRTVTVRPDGSIMSTPDPVRVAEAAAQPSAQIETDFSPVDAPEPVTVRTVTVNPDGDRPSSSLPGGTAPPVPQTGAAPQPLLPVEGRPAAPADRDIRGGVEEPAGTAGEPAMEAQLAMLPRARPAQVPAAFRSRAAQPSDSQPTQTRPAATSRGGQPVDLLAAAPRSQAQPAQPATQQAAASPFAVQLSSQRSEDQARAAFNGLKSQYPSLLGSRNADIERADLGERGIYYRVRVGMQSQAEAVQLCEQLKAAGGNCFVSR